MLQEKNLPEDEINSQDLEMDEPLQVILEELNNESNNEEN
jgi:hypothetical protein